MMCWIAYGISKTSVTRLKKKKLFFKVETSNKLLSSIDNFKTDDNKIFTITNANASEAFGITLEPKGGSKTPTMEQLYTLGIMASTP